MYDLVPFIEQMEVIHQIFNFSVILLENNI